MGQGLTAPGGRFGATGEAGHEPGPPAIAAARRLIATRPLTVLLLACLALGALSLLLPSTPTYDPWAWIIWGREILEGDLDTREGPSWKPLPVLFTTVFSLAGDAAPALWLVVARAGAFLGVAMAYRLAARLAGRWAGAVAAVGLVLSAGFLRNAALGNSEGLLVGLVLFAVERHLDGRRDHALLLAFAAGLLRPEVWPFLGLYGLFLLVRDPPLRRLVIGLGVLLPLLWLGPEYWGSGDALRASNRAQAPNADSPAFAAHPALEVLKDAARLNLWPLLVGAAVAAVAALGAFAARRERGAVLALTTGALAWTGLVALMTEAGYAGNLRYLALAGAIACVTGAVGLMWAARWLARLVSPAGRAGTALAAGLIVLAVAPFAVAEVLSLHKVTEGVQREANLHSDLQAAIARGGGPDRLLACGEPFTGPYQVPVLAWELGVHTGRVELEPRAPGVVFRARPIVPKGAEIVVPRAGPPFRRVASAGRWQLFTRCRSPRAATFTTASNR